MLTVEKRYPGDIFFHTDIRPIDNGTDDLACEELEKSIIVKVSEVTKARLQGQRHDQSELGHNGIKQHVCTVTRQLATFELAQFIRQLQQLVIVLRMGQMHHA